jgi:hypothetical protein
VHILGGVHSSRPVRPQVHSHHRLDGDAIDEHGGARAAAPTSASTTHDDGGFTVATEAPPIYELHGSGTLPRHRATLALRQQVLDALAL